MLEFGDGRRVAELLRVNSELASEIRRLARSHECEPRSGPMPSARRLTGVEEERDLASAELESVRAELVESQLHRDQLAAQNHDLGVQNHNLAAQSHDLEVQNHDLAVEVARLRSGYAGFLRRARARLLRN